MEAFLADTPMSFVVADKLTFGLLLRAAMRSYPMCTMPSSFYHNREHMPSDGGCPDGCTPSLTDL